MPDLHHIFPDRVMLAGDTALDHLEADQQARRAFQLLLQQRIAANEMLIQAEREAQPRLNRRNASVDLVPIKRHAGFEA